jgi:hypothetical protein
LGKFYVMKFKNLQKLISIYFIFIFKSNEFKQISAILN